MTGSELGNRQVQVTVNDSVEAHASRITNNNEVKRLIQCVRKDTVYAVETFLEENGIALYSTHIKGDELLVGERVCLNVIRQILEEDDR